jgi:hypothetical protein
VPCWVHVVRSLCSRSIRVLSLRKCQEKDQTKIENKINLSRTPSLPKYFFKASLRGLGRISHACKHTKKETKYLGMYHISPPGCGLRNRRDQLVVAIACSRDDRVGVSSFVGRSRCPLFCFVVGRRSEYMQAYGDRREVSGDVAHLLTWLGSALPEGR